MANRLAKLMSGSDILHVPYKGSAPLLNDLLGGQVQLAFDNLPAALPHIRSGKLRVLAVTTAQRVPQLPEVPTMIESGIKGFDVAPAEVREKMAQQGAEPTPSTMEELATLVRTETAHWVVKDTKAAVG